MPISFVASTSVAGFTTTPATVTSNVPAGVTDDDLMLAFITISSNTTVIVPPAGWTELDSISHNVNTPQRSAIYYRVASSEPASYAWAHDGTNRWQGVLVQAWRDVDTSTPFDTVYSQATHTEHYPGDPNPPNEAITTVTDAARVILFHFYRSALDTSVAPSGYSLDANSINAANRTLQVADRSVATAGAEAPGDWLHTDTETDKDSQVWSIALRPASTRSITNIDGDDDVRAGQTSITVTTVGMDSSPTVKTATLGGESLTVVSAGETSWVVSVPEAIILKWGEGDYDLVLTDDTGSVTLNNVTLSAATGWEYVNPTFASGAPNTSTTESAYELVLNDLVLTMIAGDQFQWETVTGLSFESDQTIASVIPAAAVTASTYKFWDDSAGTLSAETAFNVYQKPILTAGSFTAG